MRLWAGQAHGGPGDAAAHSSPQRQRLTGTPRFASLRSHYGEEQARRDDLESLVYVLVYLCKGRLPWQGLGASRSKRRTRGCDYKRIAEMKASVAPDVLCSNLPLAFVQTLTYARKLPFPAMPDYEYLVGLWDVAAKHLAGPV